MNTEKGPKWITVGPVLLLALAMSMLSAGPALAQENRAPTVLTVAAADEFDLGQSGLIIATLTDKTGKPIAGARVTYVTPAEFAGAVAEVDLGESETDENGQARLVYQFRTEGRIQIVARYFGNERYQPVQSSVAVTVGGTAQLYQPKAGLQIPVFGSWTLAAILLGVWSVYFVSLAVVWGIARRPAGGEV